MFIKSRKYFKGTVQRDFLPQIFLMNGFIPSPLLGVCRLFKFGFKIGEIVAIFDWLSAIVYNGELILPILFTKESCDSLHRSQQEVTNVWIFCRNSGRPFNAGSWYSPYCLIRRVMTPRIVVAGNHWEQQGVFINNFEELPLPLKGHWNKKSTMHV